MCGYCSTSQYLTGVIFALPRLNAYAFYDYIGTADVADCMTGYPDKNIRMTTLQSYSVDYCTKDKCIIVRGHDV
jgi:hypothetical protein